MANQITTKLDLDSSGFVSQLKKVKADIMSAEGATGKLKASAAGLGGVLKENLAGAAMAAGTALAVFAVKAVQAFQDLALESGKFADATGVNVEEASRLSEVAGDLGIELSSVQGALQKFNKAAADGVVDVEGFGNTVVTTADGVTDSYQSFINAATAIGAIEDPAKRAEAAQRAFGRSYGEIAELMEMDAEGLRVALDGVGEGKVISEEELEKARAFRDGMDRIKDAVDEVTLAVGGAVAGNSALLETFADTLGIISKYADEAARLADAYLTVTNPIYAFNRVLGLAADELDLTSMSLEELQAKLKDEGFSTEQIDRATEAWHRANDAIKETSASADEAGFAVDRFTVSTEESAKATSRAASVADAHATAVGILQNRIDNYKNSVDDIDEEKLTEIQAAINAGDLARAEALLNEVTRSRVVQVGIAINSGALAGATAGAKTIGGSVGAGIAAAIAGIKLPSSVTGGGGGGGGGSSIAKEESDGWDEAIKKAYEYGELTHQEYIDYLTTRMAGEDRYSDAYYKYWKERQSLEQMLDDQAEKRRKDEEAAAEEAERVAKKQADELQKRLDREAELASIMEGARRAALEAFSGTRGITIYANSPTETINLIKQYERSNGTGWRSS